VIMVRFKALPVCSKLPLYPRSLRILYDSLESIVVDLSTTEDEVGGG